MKFLTHGNKTVNLNSVTNIVIENNKLIFNLDYGVSLNNDNPKIIPDYVYFTYNNNEEFETHKLFIEDLNWLKSDFGSYDYHGNYKPNNRIVNPDKISFIKYEDNENREDRTPRIIFNLRTTISFKRYNDQMTSDFVYFDYTSTEDYELELKQIQTRLGV